MASPSNLFTRSGYFRFYLDFFFTKKCCILSFYLTNNLFVFLFEYFLNCDILLDLCIKNQSIVYNIFTCFCSRFRYCCFGEKFIHIKQRYLYAKKVLSSMLLEQLGLAKIDRTSPALVARDSSYFNQSTLAIEMLGHAYPRPQRPTCFQR